MSVAVAVCGPLKLLAAVAAMVNALTPMFAEVVGTETTLWLACAAKVPLCENDWMPARLPEETVAASA